MFINSNKHSYMYFTTSQPLPLQNFKPPFLENHSSLLKSSFRITFLDPERINDEELGFGVCVVA
jgi:hypothetical protein